MGTDAWENWRAFLDGAHEYENYEDELHSDVAFTGNSVSYGPYIFSAVSGKQRGQVSPAVLVRNSLRADLMRLPVIDGERAPQASDGYHNGVIGDELAALVSLELGVRLRFAGTRRSSGIHLYDTHLPPLFFDVPKLTRPGPSTREMLPRVLRRRASLSALPLLRSFPKVSADAQASLVRAARSYSSALWWANEDPNLAWLQLITAIETAAAHVGLDEGNESLSDLEVLRTAEPDVWVALDGNDEARSRVAAVLAPKKLVTRKFTNFLVNRKPPPPPEEERPSFDLLYWNDFRTSARKVYSQRSAALHTGSPFPLPMLGEPSVSESGAIQEVPSGNGTAGRGGVWHTEDTPMLLSTFEYITREALLTWWREIAD
ncbi:hypothetical protein [Gordonia hongkongensis]|uniref:hypothetical protein n=1 Tax=Gordonia hongkongensis TaxID=1701090 RepID=UPI003D714740